MNTYTTLYIARPYSLFNFEPFSKVVVTGLNSFWIWEIWTNFRKSVCGFRLAQQKIRTCNQRHSHSNVPTIPEDGVYCLQLIRFARTCRGVFKLFATLSACSLHSFFLQRQHPLSGNLLSHKFLNNFLTLSFKKKLKVELLYFFWLPRILSDI
jgi:hypothetical protein